MAVVWLAEDGLFESDTCVAFDLITRNSHQSMPTDVLARIADTPHISSPPNRHRPLQREWVLLETGSSPKLK